MAGRDNIVTNNNYCYFFLSNVGRRVLPLPERGRASASNISPRRRRRLTDYVSARDKIRTGKCSGRFAIIVVVISSAHTAARVSI